MNRLPILLTLLLSSASCVLAAPPNIILILSDDMGYADIGVHGCKDIPTPNIDRIARNGVRFTDAYANAAFCTPTRAALMSGRYQQRHGNEDLPQITGPLPKAIKTFPDRMRAAGYTTIMVGKWHLGDPEGFHPPDRGFDQFFGFHGGGHMYFINPKARGGYNAPIYRDRNPVPESRYLTDAFGEEAAAYLETQRNTQKPFFLYLAFNAVHTPLQATDKYLNRFPDLSGKRKTYAAMLSAMDDAIGLTTAKLDHIGKTDNTLVIFHNDNGGPTTRNAVNGSSNAPLRGSKCETFEGGIRVPLLMQWPGIIKPGSVYRHPAITFDLTATAIALAGGDTSGLEGKNLMPYLLGQKSESPHHELFWRCRTRNNNLGMRLGNWKYVYSTEGTEAPGKNQVPAREMLFNLENDLGEQNDLSAQYPEKLRELKKRYQAWSDATDEDCRALGITPKMHKAKFKPTDSFPGFHKIINAQVSKVGEEVEVSSPGNGLLLKKLAAPITQRTTLKLTMRPARSTPSNGFLVFGADPSDAATVKCGMLVGGGKVCLFNGAYPPKTYTQKPSPVKGGEPYEVTLVIDPANGTAVANINGLTLKHTLPLHLKEIRYIGYAATRTTTGFSKVEVTRE